MLNPMLSVTSAFILTGCPAVTDKGEAFTEDEGIEGLVPSPPINLVSEVFVLEALSQHVTFHR